jgi:prepilin-type N-terminal cleavage/methylation domain-containing protein
MLKYVQKPCRSNAGYTLVEVIIALAVITLVAALSLSTLSFFSGMVRRFSAQGSRDDEFRKMHLFFQKQIEKSDYLYIKDGNLYLQDMENPTKYYNYYQLNTGSGIIYRYKAAYGTLQNIGLGETSQFSSAATQFGLQAGKNAAGQFTGNVELTVQFAGDGQGAVYKAVILYPGGKDAIKTLQ